jgi:hypothetical protein
METKHLYSFPAAGSLKEKRMCGFAAFDDAKHTEAANAAVEEATKLDEKADDVSKGNDALKKIDDAHKKIKEIRDALPSASVDEVPAMNEAVRKLEPKVRGARELFERKMIKIVEAHGKEAVKKINASPNVALAPDPETAIQEGFKNANEQTEPNVALLNAYATAIRDINAAKIPLMTLPVVGPPAVAAARVYPGAAAIAKGVLPGAIDTKQDDREKAIAEDKRIKENPGSTRKGGIPETDAASEDYRKALEAEITAAKAIIKDPAKTATDKVKATDKLKAATDRLTALENAERVRKGTTAPSAGPSATPGEIEKKYKDQIDAIRGADGKPASEISKVLKEVNSKVAEADRPAVALEASKTMRNHQAVVEPTTKEIDMKLNTSPQGQEVQEGLTIKKIVELILKFLGEVGVLPKEMAGKLTESRIDGKIAELKAEKAKLDPTKDADKIKAIDRYIVELEKARPIVMEAGKIGVTVHVDENGKLTFEGPPDKVKKIQAMLSNLNVRFRPDGGRVEIDKIDAATVKRLLQALAQLAMAYRNGHGFGYVPGYGYGPGGYWNGAQSGFDAFGNPYAHAGQFGGISGKGASRQRA